MNPKLSGGKTMPMNSDLQIMSVGLIWFIVFLRVIQDT